MTDQIDTHLGKERVKLRRLLREARQYVSDAGSDEDCEARRNAQALLADIDAALENR